MVLKRDDGCISSGYVSVDDLGYDRMSDEEKQEVWVKLLENLTYSDNNCLSLINWFIDTYGHYNYLYHCEQCGDTVGEFVAEI